MSYPDLEYFVSFHEDRWVDRAPDPDDKWDYGDDGGSVSILGISRTREPGRGMTTESVNKYGSFYGLDKISAGEKVHVVTVSYVTGSTFGSSFAWEVVGIFKDKDRARDVELDCFKPRKDSTLVSADFSYGSRPWDGYFEYLVGVEVKELIMGI